MGERFVISWIVIMCVYSNYVLGDVNELPSSQQVAIHYKNNNDGSGSYHFRYDCVDGQSREETGELQKKGQKDSWISVKGSYSYIGKDDGKNYTVLYMADKRGYRAVINLYKTAVENCKTVNGTTTSINRKQYDDVGNASGRNQEEKSSDSNSAINEVKSLTPDTGIENLESKVKKYLNEVKINESEESKFAHEGGTKMIVDYAVDLTSDEFDKLPPPEKIGGFNVLPSTLRNLTFDIRLNNASLGDGNGNRKQKKTLLFAYFNGKLVLLGPLLI